MLLNKESLLPDIYLQIEYLEGHGDQYINTGVLSQLNIQAKYKIAFTRIDVIQQVCAEFNSGTTNKIYFPYADNASWKFSFGRTVETFPDKSISINTIYNIESNMFNGNYNIKIDNDIYTSSSGATVMEVPKYLYLFASNNDTNKRPAYAKIYNMTLKDLSTNDILLNLIPCIRKNDSKPGMYDTINNSFLTNIGTDEFYIPT